MRWSWPFVFFLISISQLFAQDISSKNPAKTDSLSKVFWLPQYQSLLNPLAPEFDEVGLHLEMIAPLPAKTPGYYDLKNVMPADPFLWDQRESSYYTPRIVEEKMAAVMNRPKPGEVVPVFAMAMIAAHLAYQQLDIQKKIIITAENYLIEERCWPILLALLEKSPQTSAEIYHSQPVFKNHTMSILEKDLQYLADQKIVKINRPEKAEALYFAAQSKAEIIRLLSERLALPDQTGLPREQLQKLLILLKAVPK